MTDRPTVDWELHAGQWAVYESPARFRVVVAGRRWGKTHLGRTILLDAALNGKGLFWYIAPTRVMAKDIMWEDLKAAVQPWLAYAPLETELLVRLVNGSRIHLIGAEDPDSLRGRGLDGAVLDEFADMDPRAWTEGIRPALADRRGWAVFPGTPKSFNHFHELFLLGQTDDPDWASWQFRTIENPHLPAVEIEAAKRDMDTRTFRQEFEASFEALSGRVYYGFDRRIHIHPVTLDPGAPVDIACDFNVDPCCAVISQKLGDEARVWREVKVRHAGGEATRAMATKARDLLRAVGWSGEVRLFGDPAGRAAKTTGPSDHAILREVFPGASWCIPGHAPHVRDRIASVNSRLRSLDGASHARLDPTCVGLVADLEQVTFDETGQIDKRTNPELTHLSDAWGYWVERLWRQGRAAFGTAHLELP